MILAALGFVFGAWLLQQQPVLPGIFIGLQAAWIVVPSLAVYIYLYHSEFPRLLKSISGLLIAALLGFMWAANYAAVRLSDELPAEWQQKSISVIGVVASLPEVTERGERFRFDVEKILTPQAKLPQHISLNFYRNATSLRPEDAQTARNHFHAGERWQFTVRLKRPHTTYNPHGFDFEAWALAENIRATGSIHSKSAYKKLANFVWRPSYMVENIREKIGNRISQTLENKPYAGVIRALVVGDDSQISQAHWDVFLHTGINHLVSISGLHITMLAGLMYAIVAFAWRRIPSFVMSMPAHKAATIAGLIVALAYALLAGMSVPTQRTLLMLATFALALIAGRNMAISRALAIALLVVVVVDPWAVIAPGFWLSFGAVALIACITVARLKPLSAFKNAVHTQWAITLGLLPLLIIMFGQASIISPVANAFAIPVISLLVVPLSISGSFIPVDFILQAAYFVLEVCMQGLMFLSNLPTWQQAAPPIWTLLLAMLGVIWMLLPRGFPQRWLGVVLLLPLFYVSPVKLAEGEMRATVLDVGQGLAVVVQTKNHTFLYDAGPRYSAQSDAGSRIVVPFLRGAGIKKLDGFMISHDDLDHSGGAISVLAQLPIGWLASSFSQTDSMILPPKAIKCFAGQTWRWDKVEFEVLAPALASYQNASIKDNNRSCVVKVSSPFGSLLLPGDIEKEAENALLDDVIESDGLQANQDKASGDAVYPRLASRLKSDVVIAPHHGSKTSSTSKFVQAVGAQHTIFTVGYLNRFKHPKGLIEKRFAENGALTYRSDYHGALTLNFTQSNGINVNALRQSQPRYWHDKY
ncbi:MAG TPA: DNA internalization-related competence protein ComEC/Rec2 [Methylotenera sp.]|nr:DNA internalization-related competence protein ComEC/Rec2 [Methylotenera sp.]